MFSAVSGDVYDALQFRFHILCQCRSECRQCVHEVESAYAALHEDHYVSVRATNVRVAVLVLYEMTDVCVFSMQMCERRDFAVVRPRNVMSTELQLRRHRY